MFAYKDDIYWIRKWFHTFVCIFLREILQNYPKEYNNILNKISINIEPIVWGFEGTITNSSNISDDFFFSSLS